MERHGRCIPAEITYFDGCSHVPLKERLWVQFRAQRVVFDSTGVIHCDLLSTIDWSLHLNDYILSTLPSIQKTEQVCSLMKPQV